MQGFNKNVIFLSTTVEFDFIIDWQAERRHRVVNISASYLEGVLD
jgi:hypothetical protein